MMILMSLSQGPMTLVAMKIFAVELLYATDRLMRDAVALESIFSLAFTSEFNFKLDDAIVNGDGVGKPLGITSSAGPRVNIAP